MADYSKEDLQAALNKLPLEAGDVVFSHSNLGFFGRPEGIAAKDQVCRMFAEEILRRLGPNGTLVVPTFTYSFPREQIFDRQQSRTNMGMFAEWLRQHPHSFRSLDPCYSVVAYGAAASELTKNVSANSFDERSFFARFKNKGGKILNLNFDAGSTFVHYVERQLNVPYRFDKTFTGTIRDDGREYQTTSTIWVRYLSDDSLEAAFEGFDQCAREANVFHTQRLGRGEIGVISAQDCGDLIRDTLPARPWLLTKAEALGIHSPRIVPE